MFLSELNSEEAFEKLTKEASTFKAFYEYWLEQLFERVMRIFVWEGTADIPAKEIEQRLLISGTCGIAIPKSTIKKELTAFYGKFSGIGKYYDEKPLYIVHCPVYTDTYEVGKDIVVLDNNSLRNSTYELVHHYAILLAHTDVTLTMAMINSRSMGMPVAESEKQKQSINRYFNNLFKGIYGAVTNPDLDGITTITLGSTANESIVNIQQTKEKILKSFYSDIGVRSAFEKRSNAVESEVEADTALLLLNLSDMLACRQRGAEAVNAMFGTNWSVKIADEINVGLEVGMNENSEGNASEGNNRREEDAE